MIGLLSLPVRSAVQIRPPRICPPGFRRSRQTEDQKTIKMNLIIETEQEKDGSWIAGTAELPGALAYGTSRQEAITKVEALALRILADRLEHGETSIILPSISFVAA